MAPPGEVGVPRHLRPLAAALAVAVEVVVLRHVVVVLGQHRRGEVVELARDVDVIENKVLQGGAAALHAADESAEVGVVLIGAVLLLDSARAAGAGVEHLVEGTVVVDARLAFQQAFVDLLGVGRDIEELAVLLHAHEETL